MNAGYRFGVGEMWDLNAAMFDEMTRACRDARDPARLRSHPADDDGRVPGPGGIHLTKPARRSCRPAGRHEGTVRAPSTSKRDMHLNEAGHVLIAAQVEAFLRAHPEALRGREAANPESR